MTTDRRLSFAEIESQFREAMRATGLATEDSIRADGELHRFHVEGDKRNARNGWYALHTDGIPAGAFGSWRTGQSEAWRAEIGRSLTATEESDFRRRMDEARTAREADEAKRHAEARAKAARLWKDAARRVHSDHPYLTAKGVRAYGLRQLKEQLIVPVRDGTGELHGLQFIDAGGSKKFLTGTAKAGHYHSIGKAGGGMLAIAEGYATAATVHELTGWPVAVAFDAGNLRSVAEALCAKFPSARIIVAADNDRGTEGNPGLTKAREAAQTVGGTALAPEFNDGEAGSDWNDWAALRGADAAREVFLRGADVCPALAPQAPAPVAAALSPRGEADAVIPAEAASKPRTGGRAKRGNYGGGNRSGAHFEVSDAGLYWHGVTNDGEPLPPQRVGPPIYVRARLRDDEESNWGILVEFTDSAGTPHRWGVPARILVKRDEVMSELLRLGYGFAPTQSNQNRVLEYLGQSHELPLARSVERTGWQGRAYVLPDRVIGNPDHPVYFQAENLQDNPYQCRGDLSGWRTDVADLCRGNSRLVFGVSMAFAATLLHWVDEESGGFHLRGDSSIGKSTVQYVAASVFGAPDYVEKWRGTPNSIEAVAAAHNDALLILDDIKNIDPAAAGECAFTLAGGVSKNRMQKTTALRPKLRWRLLFLSSGEKSLAAHMGEVGKKADAGHDVRMAEIPAEVARGSLFETLHGCANGHTFSETLKKAAAEHYGTAAQNFIAALLPHLDTLPATLQEQRDAFCKRMLLAKADGQAWRVAGRFALVAAAGELATKLGITGWEQGEAERATASCLTAWIEQRGGTGNVEPARMLAQVRNFLEKHGESRFQPWTLSNDDKTKWTTNNRAGFRRGAESSFDDPAITYYVMPGVFRDEVCAGFDHRAVQRVLAEAGALKMPLKGGHYTRKERLPGLESTHCYVILPAIWEDEEPEDSTNDSGSASNSVGTVGQWGQPK